MGEYKVVKLDCGRYAAKYKSWWTLGWKYIDGALFLNRKATSIYVRQVSKINAERLVSEHKGLKEVEEWLN